MKEIRRIMTTALLTALALVATAVRLSGPAASGATPSVEAPIEVAQSTTAILEGRAA